MVTMNSDKAAAKRKPEPNNGGCTATSTNEESFVPSQQQQQQQPVEESPNHLLYKKVLPFLQPNVSKYVNWICCITFRWRKL